MLIHYRFRVKQRSQQLDASDAVDHAVVYSREMSRAIAAETAHKLDLPDWLVAVERRRKELARELL
jgi:hypothetical protein